jgi:hypothetical protein
MKSLSPSLVAASLVLLSVSARAQNSVSSHPIELKLGDTIQDVQVESAIKVILSGWLRLDYGYGNRFGDASGRDELGVSKMALKTEAQYENFNFVAVLGASIVSDLPTDTEFKDLFLVWNQVGGTAATVQIGAQPILFGLKPNGYPGDRSLQPSIEFGGAGAFPVSNQAGPSVRAIYPVEGLGQVEAGVFDTAETTTGPPTNSLDGSRIYRNYYGQMRFKDFGVQGLGGVIGYEGRYVGAADDSVEPIIDLGIDYGTDLFDASLEYILLDQDITGTSDDETYWVAELTAFLRGGWMALADFATADELNATTVRIGTQYAINPHVDLNLEFAHDRIAEASDVDSGQARLTFHF